LGIVLTDAVVHESADETARERARSGAGQRRGQHSSRNQGSDPRDSNHAERREKAGAGACQAADRGTSSCA